MKLASQLELILNTLANEGFVTECEMIEETKKTITYLITSNLIESHPVYLKIVIDKKRNVLFSTSVYHIDD